MAKYRSKAELSLITELVQVLRKGLLGVSIEKQSEFHAHKGMTYQIAYTDPGKIDTQSVRDMMVYAQLIGILGMNEPTPLLRRLRMVTQTDRIYSWPYTT